MNGSHNLGFKLSSFGVMASVALLSLPTPAAAQSTWTGAVNGNWNTAGNWSAGVPTSGINTQLIFGTTANPAMVNNIPGNFQLNQMTFNAGAPAYTLAGGIIDFRANAAAC